MTHQFAVSDLGFRLIKAYEGFRAESRVLISGENVVGYGHRISDQDVIALTAAEADTLLRKDIKPVEDLVNEAVFSPLSQGQFDALCSLAYNIGPDAFLKSDVIKAVNNGRPIEAANSFDIWRKGEIDGQIFVIDALVRRRTAEKALFLKPERGSATSPRDLLPPKPDGDIAPFIADSPPVYTGDDAQGYVDAVPYDQRPNPGRRREDGPAGILELSEYYDEAADESSHPVITVGLALEREPKADISSNIASASKTSTDLTLSPIAEAAAEVSERLDALIAGQADERTEPLDMPKTLLNAEPTARRNKILPFRRKTTRIDKPKETAPDRADKAVDEVRPTPDLEHQVDLEHQMSGPAANEGRDSASRFINKPQYIKTETSSIWAYGIMMASGLILMCLSLYAKLKGAVSLLGPWGDIAVLAGLIMGGVIILGSIYYIMKSVLSE